MSTVAPAPSPAPPPPPPSSRGGWHPRAAWMWLVLSCVLSIVIDLGSKEWAFARIAPQPVVVRHADVMRVIDTLGARMISQPEAGIVPRHEAMVVIPSLLNFQLVLNPGAVFGIGPGKRAFFVSFTVVALFFGMAMFAKWTGPRDHFAHAAIGLLIGGGLGNLYDRLALGCVRDFIHPLPGMMWPSGMQSVTMRVLGTTEVWPYVSNLADLFLLIGIVMLLIHLWKRDREAERAARGAAGATVNPMTAV